MAPENHRAWLVWRGRFNLRSGSPRTSDLTYVASKRKLVRMLGRGAPWPSFTLGVRWFARSPPALERVRPQPGHRSPLVRRAPSRPHGATSYSPHGRRDKLRDLLHSRRDRLAPTEFGLTDDRPPAEGSGCVERRLLDSRHGIDPLRRWVGQGHRLLAHSQRHPATP